MILYHSAIIKIARILFTITTALTSTQLMFPNAFATRATDRISISEQPFFIAHSHARWLFIWLLSTLNCLPTPVMKSMIISIDSIPICSAGIFRYQNTATAPRYHDIFMFAIIEEVSSGSIAIIG
jgi:hypothetical protein